MESLGPFRTEVVVAIESPSGVSSAKFVLDAGQSNRAFPFELSVSPGSIVNRRLALAGGGGDVKPRSPAVTFYTLTAVFA